MTGREYLRVLRAKLPRFVPQVREEERAMRERQGVYLNREPSTWEDMDDFFRGILIAPFLSSLDSRVTQVLNNIHVGYLPTGSPNAMALKVPDVDEPVITINHRLLPALRAYNEYLIGCSRRPGVAADRIMDEGLNAVVADILGHGNFRYPLADVGSSRFDVAQFHVLATAQELFVVAHEFAHVYLGHLNTHARQIFRFADQSVEAEVYTFEQRQEFEADLQAFQWLLDFREWLRKGGQVNLYLGIAGELPHFAVQIFMVFRLAEVASGRRSRSSSHPDATSRLRLLVDRAGDRISPNERTYLEQTIVNMQELG